MEIFNNTNTQTLLNRLKSNDTTNIKNDNNTLPREGVIEGKVIDVKGLAVKILTAEGQHISGKMLESELLNKGENKMFEVFTENGQTKMRPLNLTPEQNKAMQIKKALAELGIINSEMDEAVASELMNNELPVNEKMLKDLGRLLKLFNAQEDTPLEDTKNLENSKNINNLNPDATKTQQQNETEVSEKNILNSKNVDKGVFILKNEIPINAKNTKLVTSFSNNEVNIQNDLTEISNTIQNLSLNNPELKETLENIIKFNDENGVTEKNVLSKTNLENIQNLLKNENDGQKLLNLLGNKINEATGEKFTITDLLNLSKNNLKEILKDVDKGNLAKLVKDSKQDLDFSFKLNSGTLDEVDDFFKETTTKFEKLLQELQKKDDDTSKELFNKIVDTKDKMDFSNHIKTNIFLQLPLNINNHKTNGELTIFKDKRKKGKSSVSSALIALDTLNLGNFETFIQKHNNNLNLQFRLENEDIQNIVKNEVDSLVGILNALRYQVESISFKTCEQSFSILNSEKDLHDLQLNTNTSLINTKFEAKA